MADRAPHRGGQHEELRQLAHGRRLRPRRRHYLCLRLPPPREEPAPERRPSLFVMCLRSCSIVSELTGRLWLILTTPRSFASFAIFLFTLALAVRLLSNKGLIVIKFNQEVFLNISPKRA